MLVIDNKKLFDLLFHRYTATGRFKGLYPSLFDTHGKPLDSRIPSSVVAIKRVEFTQNRFVFHDYGQNSFAIGSGGDS